MLGEPSPADPQSFSEFLTADELAAIEDDLARAERTLSLLADDDTDPVDVAAWLADSPTGEQDGSAGAATRS